MILAYEHPDPVSRVPLLAHSLQIRNQHRSICAITGPSLGASRTSLWARGNRAPQRLPHHPPAHSMLLGEP